MLEEQIPKYKIRNDFLTDFAGYANEDWFVPAPALPIPVEGLGLTKEQTRECLNYFRKSLFAFLYQLYCVKRTASLALLQSQLLINVKVLIVI